MGLSRIGCRRPGCNGRLTKLVTEQVKAAHVVVPRCKARVGEGTALELSIAILVICMTRSPICAFAFIVASISQGECRRVVFRTGLVG